MFDTGPDTSTDERSGAVRGENSEIRYVRLDPRHVRNHYRLWVQQVHLLEIFHFSMAIHMDWELVPSEPIAAFPPGGAPIIIGELNSPGGAKLRVIAAQIGSDISAAAYVRDVITADASRFAYCVPRENKQRGGERDCVDLLFHYQTDKPMVARVFGYTVRKKIVASMERRVFFGLELHVPQDEYQNDASEPFYVAKVTFKPEA
jgi:hypothetical protein